VEFVPNGENVDLLGPADATPPSSTP
jgi:hypothetical protein